MENRRAGEPSPLQSSFADLSLLPPMSASRDQLTEDSEPNRQLRARVEVGEPQDDVGNEASAQGADDEAVGQEGGTSSHAELRHREGAPEDELGGDPDRG